MKGKGFAGLELHPTMAEIVGGAELGVAMARARATVLSPDLDGLLEAATLMKSFFGGGVTHDENI